MSIASKAIEAFRRKWGIKAQWLTAAGAFVLFDKSGNVVIDASSGVAKNAAGSTLTFGVAKVVTSTPVTGGTVTVDSTMVDQVINLTPAGTLATLTFTFPSNSNSAIGQRLTLQSSQIVTALTVSSSGLTLNGDAVTALAVNSPVSWVKTAASTWMRTSTPATQALTNLLAGTGSTQALRNSLQSPTTSSPVTTNTVTSNALGLDDIQYLTPAGTIAALTYVFPSDANSQLGQIIEVTSTQIVTTLTITSTALTLVGTAVTALAANTPVRWRKVKASTWLRLV